ncbi:MAG: triple tyrosine motif-containing protein, partial [Candidatus Poribacteria bacterium]|nr:triple tyrosine motif-containing protein [Candidatus Poribacteria bacterium]
VDKNWYEAGTTRRGRYTGLQGGTYALQVMATNKDGQWSDHIAELRVVVDRPPWQTWWFRIIVVVSVLALAFGWYRRRIRNIETQRKNLEIQVAEKTKELRQRNEFIRSVFGRYLTDEVVANLLQSPENLQVGGQMREVTILVSDLRGFSTLSEGLPPEKVVTLLNTYLGAMTDVILRYEGTIDEFLGDGILVIFGAPIFKADHAKRAVECAVEMQLAMEEVNEQNRRVGLPEIAMGIGINTGEVVVGNIGSEKRAKYGIVGNDVNLAYRIESYTVGGQILISDETQRAVKSGVKITNQMKVEPKGVTEPITIYEVGGIGGVYNLFLPEQQAALTPLSTKIPIRYTVLEDKFAGRTIFTGHIVKVSAKAAEVESETPVAPLSNLRLQVLDTSGQAVKGDLYGKVVGPLKAGQDKFDLRFTSIPKEVGAFLQGHIQGESTR